MCLFALWFAKKHTIYFMEPSSHGTSCVAIQWFTKSHKLQSDQERCTALINKTGAYKNSNPIWNCISQTNGTRRGQKILVVLKNEWFYTPLGVPLNASRSMAFRRHLKTVCMMLLDTLSFASLICMVNCIPKSHTLQFMEHIVCTAVETETVPGALPRETACIVCVRKSNPLDRQSWRCRYLVLAGNMC